VSGSQGLEWIPVLWFYLEGVLMTTAMIVNALVVFVYLLSMVVLGVVMSRYVKGDDDYFLAGRSLNKWVVAGTIMATNVAAIYLVGPAGAAYKGGGVSVLLIAWTGNMIAAVSALFFVPRLRRLRITTVSEFLEERYGVSMRLLPAALWIIYYALFAGNAIYTLATVLEPVLGINPQIIILFVSGGVILYCFSSGLVAAAYTSVIQSFLMIVGGLLLLPLSLKAVGGISGLASQVPESFFVFWKSGDVWPTWKDVIMFTILGLPYWCTSQYMLQRSFAGRSVRAAGRGVILAALLTGPLTLSYIVPGICGAVLYKDTLEVADSVLPRLLVDYLPMGLAGLFLAGLVAASNSTAAALLNSLATLTEHDFYRRFVPGKTSSHYLRVGRIATLVGGLVGLLFAFNVQRLGGIIEANYAIMSFFEPPIFIVVAAALFWRKANLSGAVATIVGGMLFSGIAAAQGMGSADRTLWAFPVCLVLMIAGTLFGERFFARDPEKQRLADELIGRMRGLRFDYSIRSGVFGCVWAVLSLVGFVACAVWEEALPKPGNLLIFMGLMMSFVLGCYLAVPTLLPGESEQGDEGEQAIDRSIISLIVGNGWTWFAVYVVAALLVAILYWL
jgi:SSS family solute:Na+ symporter